MSISIAPTCGTKDQEKVINNIFRLGLCSFCHVVSAQPPAAPQRGVSFACSCTSKVLNQLKYQLALHLPYSKSVAQIFLRAEDDGRLRSANGKVSFYLVSQL